MSCVNSLWGGLCLSLCAFLCRLRPPRCVSTGPVVVRLAGMANERERERGLRRRLGIPTASLTKRPEFGGVLLTVEEIKEKKEKEKKKKEEKRETVADIGTDTVCC